MFASPGPIAFQIPQIGGFVIYLLMVVLLLLFPAGLYGRRT